jgi:hypothetical protein
MTVDCGVVVGRNGLGDLTRGRKFDVSLFVPTPHPIFLNQLYESPRQTKFEAQLSRSASQELPLLP